MQQTKLSPKFFFLSLGVLITLITSVVAALNLTFEILNFAFPDVLTDMYRYGYYNYSFDGMRSALALLIIFFPIYLVLQRLWLRVSSGTLSHWEEVLRKWAIYLIIFLASITLAADLVTLVRYFVSGEITTRFILKVAAVLIVAGGAGWYYVRELGRGLTKRDTKAKWFAIVAEVLVLGVIAWAFCIMGNPGTQRDLRLDQRRTEDLQSIQWQVISYWQQKEQLPESFTDLSNPISSYMVPQDPEFEDGRAYEYRTVTDKSFELCATFTEPMPEGWVPGSSGGGMYPMMDIAISARPAMAPGGMTGDNSWDHEAGRTCFLRTIDPDLYPPYPKPMSEPAVIKG